MAVLTKEKAASLFIEDIRGNSDRLKNKLSVEVFCVEEGFDVVMKTIADICGDQLFFISSKLLRTEEKDLFDFKFKEELPEAPVLVSNIDEGSDEFEYDNLRKAFVNNLIYFFNQDKRDITFEVILSCFIQTLKASLDLGFTLNYMPWSQDLRDVIEEELVSDFLPEVEEAFKQLGFN